MMGGGGVVFLVLILELEKSMFIKYCSSLEAF